MGHNCRDVWREEFISRGGDVQEEDQQTDHGSYQNEYLEGRDCDRSLPI